MDFTGLVFLEQQPNAMAVHLVKGEALSLGEHVPQMWVPSDVIDQTATAKPNASHVIQLGDDEFWLWDLNGVKVATPSPPTGQPELKLNEADIGQAAQPANDEGWRSLAWVPDVRVLSGATKIVNRDALTSTITLTHGSLESAKATGVGPFAVWRFTNPGGQVLMRRALTNRVVYSCPTQGQAATINVGDHKIVFQPNADAVVSVRNLPSESSPHPVCPAPCKPNLNHFVAFFALVDAQFTPTAVLDSFNPPPNMDAEPEYCPPARI
jgi:hypothetical protein